MWPLESGSSKSGASSPTCNGILVQRRRCGPRFHPSIHSFSAASICSSSPELISLLLHQLHSALRDQPNGLELSRPATLLSTRNRALAGSAAASCSAAQLSLFAKH